MEDRGDVYWPTYEARKQPRNLWPVLSKPTNREESLEVIRELKHRLATMLACPDPGHQDSESSSRTDSDAAVA